MSEYLLEINSVNKSYGPKLVLDDINIKVRKGEFCSIVGPSGCGKSTLLRLVLGQETVTSGEVLIEGQRVSKPDTSRGIVYQRYSLFPHLTALENVTLGHRLSAGVLGWKKIKEQSISEATSILAKMSLGNDLHKYPHQLSGGMQQRVAIAQALIMKPKILLMDEPFGALDLGTKADIHEFVQSLWQEMKMTIFFVTHDLNEAVYLGTRILVLSQFYTNESHHVSRFNHGAKLVCDLEDIDEYENYSQMKQSPLFLNILNSIREAGFDPANLQHVRDFVLTHPDAVK